MSLKTWVSENIVDLGSEKPVVKTAPIKPKDTLQADHSDTVFVDSGSMQAGFTAPADTTFSANDLTAFRKHFQDLLTQNNIPGNDYYEFIVLKNALSAVPVEEQRYKAAYDGLAAAGLTREILDQSATKYSNLIERELSDFQAAFGQQFKTQVTDVKASIADKIKQMADLNTQISKLNKEIQETSSKADVAESSLTAKNNSFIKAGQEAKDMIATELSKIDQYIK